MPSSIIRAGTPCDALPRFSSIVVKFRYRMLDVPKKTLTRVAGLIERNRYNGIEFQGVPRTKIYANERAYLAHEWDDFTQAGFESVEMTASQLSSELSQVHFRFQRPALGGRSTRRDVRNAFSFYADQFSWRTQVFESPGNELRYYCSNPLQADEHSMSEIHA